MQAQASSPAKSSHQEVDQVPWSTMRVALLVFAVIMLSTLAFVYLQDTVHGHSLLR